MRTFTFLLFTCLVCTSVATSIDSESLDSDFIDVSQHSAAELEAIQVLDSTDSATDFSHAEYHNLEELQAQAEYEANTPIALVETNTHKLVKPTISAEHDLSGYMIMAETQSQVSANLALLSAADAESEESAMEGSELHMEQVKADAIFDETACTAIPPEQPLNMIELNNKHHTDADSEVTLNVASEIEADADIMAMNAMVNEMTADSQQEIDADAAADAELEGESDTESESETDAEAEQSPSTPPVDPTATDAETAAWPATDAVGPVAPIA